MAARAQWSSHVGETETWVAGERRRCLPLMAFGPTINLGNGRERHFRGSCHSAAADVSIIDATKPVRLQSGRNPRESAPSILARDSFYVVDYQNAHRSPSGNEFEAQLRLDSGRDARPEVVWYADSRNYCAGPSIG
jgi:hypothetical protein